MRRTRSARLVTILGAAVLLATAALPLGAGEAVGGPAAGENLGFTFDPESRLFAGRIPAGAPIADIARQIGELARIDIEVRGDPGSVRHSVTLDGLGVEAALKRIAPEQSLVVAYAPEGASSEIRASGLVGRTIQQVVLGSGAPIELFSSPAPSEPAEAPDADVAHAIAQREIVRLSYAADQAAIDRLRATAATSEDPSERRAAMSALAGIAGGQSLNIFALFVDSGLADSDPGVRVEAVRSIMRLMGESGRTIVEAAARREANPAVRDAMQQLARGADVERSPAGPQVALER